MVRGPPLAVHMCKVTETGCSCGHLRLQEGKSRKSVQFAIAYKIVGCAFTCHHISFITYQYQLPFFTRLASLPAPPLLSSIYTPGHRFVVNVSAASQHQLMQVAFEVATGYGHSLATQLPSLCRSTPSTTTTRHHCFLLQHTRQPRQ